MPVQSVRGVHNPSMEVHLAYDTAAANTQDTVSKNTGAMVILVPGGGHNMLGIGGCKTLIPVLLEFGVSAVILRPRLRIDGCMLAVHMPRARRACFVS